MKIQNKTVLITGAARGIGKAMAEAFAEKKCHLIITLRKTDFELEKKLLSLGALSVTTHVVDFAKREGVDAFCRDLEKQQAQVDVLINNAGLLTGGLLESQDLSKIYEMMQVNLLTTIQLCHFFIPRMLKAGVGKIINNASVSGKMFLPCANTYAASKAGVVALTESLQAELAGTPISTLLLITPGVKTDMYDKIADDYGAHMDLSFLSSITPQAWAQRIVKAVEDDVTHLYPEGGTGFGVSLAHHFPNVFRKMMKSKFKRT